MNLRIISFLLVASFLFGGCTSSLKSSWKNFNAYYNAYYNAQKSYSLGLDKNLSQSRDYNPVQPIRIHEQPVNAGAQDFDKAIEKGANILRRHNESKWVDDALGLIGKSYYFRQDYFSAEQKFRELYITTEVPEMLQEAVIWRGRVLLELELYSEGIAYMSEQLNTLEGQWRKDKRAEAKTILAQHFVNQENWSAAAKELEQALPDLKSKKYKERGFFLLGQVYENLEEMELAFGAYDEVQNHYAEYRVQYLAQRKKAEVARSLGRNELAYDIFNDMLRDDKNIDYRAELDYELARTEHEAGNLEQAERLYNRLLRNDISRPSSEIAALTYNGLAEIYEGYYKNYKMAATYYDSAARQNANPDRLPRDFEASELAKSFGEYARIADDIAHQDSLLHLGRMTPQQFDSALAVIRQNRIDEILRLRNEQVQRQNQMVNVDQQEQQKAATDISNGFLNSKNPVMQENMKQQFYAVWGNRPLADNWRVRSMIRANSNNQQVRQQENKTVANESEEVISVNIDLSDIPFTPEEQDSVQQIIYSRQYELGTLLYLSLDMPDSAATYFEKVIDNSDDEEIIKVSLYSLSELYDNIGDRGRAVQSARELIRRYPDTNYAEWVAERFNLPLERSEEPETITPIQIYRSIALDDTLAKSQKARRLSTFALQNKTEQIAPRAQYEAIQLFIESGKEDSVYQSRINNWTIFINKSEQREADSVALKDSAITMFQDSTRLDSTYQDSTVIDSTRLDSTFQDSTVIESTRLDSTLSDSLKAENQLLADSTLHEVDQMEIFPYVGAHWDSARAAIDSFMVAFETSELSKRVSKLKEIIALPEQELTEEGLEEVASEMPGEIGADTTDTAESDYLSCTEIEQELEIREERERFMAYFNFKEDIEEMEITYLFRVNQRGVPEDYTLQTEEVAEEIQSEFERVFESYLSFEPILYEGQAVPVECSYTFQIP